MALDATKVRVGITGVISSAPTATTAPTSSSSVLTSYTDLGYVGEDGVTETQPGSGDSQGIKAWQNGATVRTVRSLTEDLPQWSFVLLETKLEVIELYYGSTVTAAVADGSFLIDTTTVRGYNSFVIDVVDGAELIRTYIPRGIVSEVGDKVYKNAEAIGYEVTIQAERDAVKGYNAKCWATALKT